MKTQMKKKPIENKKNFLHSLQIRTISFQFSTISADRRRHRQPQLACPYITQAYILELASTQSVGAQGGACSRSWGRWGQRLLMPEAAVFCWQAVHVSIKCCIS